MNRFTRIYVILALLSLFHIGSNYIWLKMDTLPPAWDQSYHLLASLAYFDILSHPFVWVDVLKLYLGVQENLPQTTMTLLSGADRYYPPLVRVLTIPFYAVFGRSVDTAVMVNSVFWVILIFSTYGIGQRICSKNTGLLAAFLVSMYPITFGMSRQYFLDFALMAVVSLGVYSLLLTNSFTNKRNSVLFGIVFGLGMLTKWTFIFFIIGPLTYMMVKIPIKNHTYHTSRYSLHSLILAAALTAVWYIPNSDSLIRLLDNATRSGSIEGDPVIYSIQSVLYYVFSLINDQISFFYFIFFVTGMILLSKRPGESRSIFLLWIVVPFIIFTFTANKETRFIIPILPAVAVVSAAGVMDIRNSKLKVSIISLILVYGLAQFFIMSYGIESMPDEKKLDTPVYPIYLFHQEGYWNRHPREEDWKIQEILRYINEIKETKQKTSPEIVCVLPDQIRFSAMAFTYYARLDSMPLQVQGYVWNPAKFYNDILSCDYVITKSGGHYALPFLRKNVRETMAIFENKSAYFETLARYTLPDNSTGLVYGRKSRF